MVASSSQVEVEVVTVFLIDQEAWSNEYGIEPGAPLLLDVATYYVASELKESLEDLRPFGPLVTRLSSVRVRVGKGPKSSLSES